MKKLERHKKTGTSFKKDVKEFEEKLESLEIELMREVMKLPNRTSPETPVGDPTMNRVIETVGTKPQFDFEIKDHSELGLFDFANASKLTGSKFAFFKHGAAELELALIL